MLMIILFDMQIDDFLHYGIGMECHGCMIYILSFTVFLYARIYQDLIVPIFI